MVKMQNQIQKAIELTEKALLATSNINSKDCNEAKSHLKQALEGLDKLQKKKNRKKEDGQKHFEQWWGNVQSGVANSGLSSMSKEAQMNSLNRLNSLIDAEQNKLDELENLKPRSQKEDSSKLITEEN